jgi:hypothetical protein
MEQLRGKCIFMNTWAPGENLVRAVSDDAVLQTGAGVARRRRISPEAGRGIEMLAHAIEYLGDELALDCLTGRAEARPRLVAIEMLKTRNREIYFGCPEVPTLGERVRGWLGW